MADRLQISASYLNLIERNQRPVTARVVMQLVSEFGFDPTEMAENASIGGVDGLVRRLADERFVDLGIDREEIDEFLSFSPQIAAAFARIYDDKGPASRTEQEYPLNTVRREIERWRNHFADLDHAAENLSDEIRLSRGDIATGLAERLREKHQLSVRILPQQIIPDALRRLDLHARQVQLSEMLSPESRAFQLAEQIAQIEQSETIASLVEGAQIKDDAGRQLFARHLASYFAAALIMPYGRFLRACEATAYDLPILQRRFSVSFEQLAHRLTSLQRVGQRGLPFFMLRIDRAGQISKRLAGASGALFLESEHLCPLWKVTETFARPEQMVLQSVRIPDSSAGPTQWFTLSRAVNGSGASAMQARYAVVLGLEARFANELSQARGQSLRDDAEWIGPGCKACHRPDCRQRSHPPLGRRLVFDRNRRALTAFELGDPQEPA